METFAARSDSDHVTYLTGTGHDRTRSSRKAGTIFEDSPLDLDKWLTAVWLMVNWMNGISSHEVLSVMLKNLIMSEFTCSISWDTAVRLNLSQGESVAANQRGCRVFAQPLCQDQWDARIKLGTCVSDLLGTSGLRMLNGLAEGERDPARLAAMAEPELRAIAEQLRDALEAGPRWAICTGKS